MECKCSVCKEQTTLEENIVLSPAQEEYYICDICSEQGWWYDPAGGLHSPDESPEDFACQYE